MTPLSTVAPVREMVSKNISDPAISTSMKLWSSSNAAAVICRSPDVALAQLSGGSGDEVLNAFLRRQAFVDVVMTREHDIARRT